ncbi:MAG TPA: heme-binding protein [Usitatibacter sp.]|nr:heme-binding protein [Usitatibacter sp.]
MIARAAAAMIAIAAFECMAAGEGSTFTVKMITPEAALKAARAAMDKCRAEGFQVTVAVVDRSGVTVSLIRDRYASPGSVDVAQRKAQTAVNFKMDTAALDRELQPGRPTAGIRSQPGVAAIAGGAIIESGGALVGAIGVSGAPGPANDDLCARAGIKAIAEDLEF